MRSGADCVPGRMLIIGRRNMNIEYRRAVAADAETLVAIYNAAFYSDLNKISAVVKEQTGVETKIMRFPGGSSNTVSKKYSAGIMSRLAKSVTENGYVYFDWNCANGDAAGANTVEKQLANCKSYPKSASNIIVLMHDSKSTTLEALPKIIEYYKSCGMSFGVLTTATPPVHHGINN